MARSTVKHDIATVAAIVNDVRFARLSMPMIEFGSVLSGTSTASTFSFCGISFRIAGKVLLREAFSSLHFSLLAVIEKDRRDAPVASGKTMHKTKRAVAWGRSVKKRNTALANPKAKRRRSIAFCSPQDA